VDQHGGVVRGTVSTRWRLTLFCAQVDVLLAKCTLICPPEFVWWSFVSGSVEQGDLGKGGKNWGDLWKAKIGKEKRILIEKIWRKKKKFCEL
jgi:hypothetical protein